MTTFEKCIWSILLFIYSLLKDVKYRSNYADLLTHPFVAEEKIMNSPDLAKYVQDVFEKYGDPNEAS